MTFRQAMHDFIDMYGGRDAFNAAKKKDYPAVQFDWSCYKDRLCKDGEITQKQYDTWDNP